MIWAIHTLLLTLLLAHEPALAPSWLPEIPGARVIDTLATPSSFKQQYTWNGARDAAVRFYSEELTRRSIHSHVAFDGVGITLQAENATSSCTVRFREADSQTEIRVACGLIHANTTYTEWIPPQPAPPTTPNAPPASPAPTQPVKAKEAGDATGQWREVVYKIWGPKTALVVLRSATGLSEEQQLRLPYSKSVWLKPGMVAEVSAENNENKGTVFTSVYVDGKLLQESSSSAVYGTAQVKLPVPSR